MKPIVAIDDSPRVRLTDPITSHEAADSISPEAREDSEREVLIILETASHPLSDAAIFARHEDRVLWNRTPRRYSESRLRTARRQLAEVGEVVLGPNRTTTRSGRSAQTWTVPARIEERSAA